MKADNTTYWHDTYREFVNGTNEFLGVLLELLPGAEDTGMDAYDQIPRAIEQLRAERDAANATITRVRAVWTEWRERLGGSFPRAMVQELTAALDASGGTETEKDR